MDDPTPTTERICVVFHLDNSQTYSSTVYNKDNQSVQRSGQIPSGLLKATLEPDEWAFGSDVRANELLDPARLAHFHAYLKSLKALEVADILATEPGNRTATSVPVRVIREVSATRCATQDDPTEASDSPTRVMPAGNRFSRPPGRSC